VKIGPGVSELLGSKVALSHWRVAVKHYFKLLYNSLYYRTNRD